jgi:hypothetical protein
METVCNAYWDNVHTASTQVAPPPTHTQLHLATQTRSNEKHEIQIQRHVTEQGQLLIYVHIPSITK